MLDADNLRPKDWSQELARVQELCAVPGMTISRALRIMDTYMGAQQFTGDKNTPNRDSAKRLNWAKYSDGTPAYRLVPVDGNTTVIPTHLNNEIIQPTVADLVTDQTDAIVELGCGFARHLLGLREVLEHRFPRIDYFGLDLSPSALQVSRALASIEHSRSGMLFRPFNYLEPDFEWLWIMGYKNVIFFSCHSIEQVEQIGFKVFEAMLNAAPAVTGVHEEPFGWQIKAPAFDNASVEIGKPVCNAWASAMPHHMRWNADLAAVLMALYESGRIDIRRMERHCSGNGIYNPGSLVVWEKSNV